MGMDMEMEMDMEMDMEMEMENGKKSIETKKSMETKKHMETIEKHFGGEAKEFDTIIMRMIPHYNQMVDALASAVSCQGLSPFQESSPLQESSAIQESPPIKVIDLGCGTGTISSAILKRYPHAQVTCLDLAENMLEMAKAKLSGYPDVRYIRADLTHFDFDDRYDFVVSSLALHHLLTDDDKRQLYRKIYNALTPHGIFYNADIVLASSDTLQEMYLNQWKRFIAKSVTQDEIENKWIPKYYEEDRPARLTDQLSWLSDIGFINVDVIWKYYNFAVYGGIKHGKVSHGEVTHGE